VIEPLDGSTPQGRSHERYRRVVLTAASSTAARALSWITALVYVPLTLNYLGTERYALWATISSTLALLSFADFGMNAGLVNVISESHGRRDENAAATYISTSFFLLLAIAVGIGCIFWSLYPFVPWSRIFNVSTAIANREVGPSVSTFVFCFLAYLPLTVVERAQLGYQMGFVNQSWEAASNCLAFLGILVAVHLHAGLVFLILAVAGAPVLTALLNAFTFFSFQRPWLLPSWHRISLSAARKIVGLGALYLLIQAAAATGYTTDNLIIAHVLGASRVTEYAVPLKLFVIAPAVCSIVFAPLWPAYGEASARGDVKWVKATLRYSLLGALVLSFLANALLFMFARTILRMWVGPRLVPSMLLLAGMACWAVLNSVTSSLTMFLNGAGFIRVQAICCTLMAISNLVISIYLTKHIGIAGVVYGTVISHTVFVLIPYFFQLPRLLAEISDRSVVLLHPQL